MESDSNAGSIMRYSFMVAFANDGTIDDNELAFMMKLALRDGTIDDEERVVLATIFSRVNEADTTPTVWKSILEFKQTYDM